jgi:hypothetical protein
MRATVQIDETLLHNARAATGGRNDTETVERALEAVVRHGRIRRLINRLGKTDLDLTQDDLERLRDDACDTALLIDTSAWIVTSPSSPPVPIGGTLVDSVPLIREDVTSLGGK